MIKKRKLVRCDHQPLPATLFLVDWGSDDVRGSRYGIIDSESFASVMLDIDSIADPGDVKVKAVNIELDPDAPFYMDVCNPNSKNYYHHLNDVDCTSEEDEERTPWLSYDEIYSVKK